MGSEQIGGRWIRRLIFLLRLAAAKSRQIFQETNFGKHHPHEPRSGDSKVIAAAAVNNGSTSGAASTGGAAQDDAEVKRSTLRSTLPLQTRMIPGRTDTHTGSRTCCRRSGFIPSIPFTHTSRDASTIHFQG